MTCLFDVEKVSRVVTAVLTLLIGAIALYIAYQQSVTNKRQLRLALYDRRMVIFNSTTNLMRAVVSQVDVTLIEMFNFAYETRECEFLFGPEIVNYLKEVLAKAAKLRVEVVTREQNPAKINELVTWFVAELDEARKKFGKYMSFPE